MVLLDLLFSDFLSWIVRLLVENIKYDKYSGKVFKIGEFKSERYNSKWGGKPRSVLGTGWVNIHDSHHNNNTVTETAF